MTMITKASEKVSTFEEFKENWAELTCKICLDHVEAVFDAGTEEQFDWRVGDSPQAGWHLLTFGPNTGQPIAVCDVTRIVNGWGDFVTLKFAGDGAVAH
jgi:hypothetical protein